MHQAADSGTGERWDVLVVDDEPVVCSAARRVLEAAGLRVATVGGGAEALAHPAAESCRVVVCDLVLGDGSGIDVIRALRRRRPDLPQVLITGYATPKQESLALEAGAAFFLAKPFEESELVRVVRSALESAHADAKENRS